MTLTLYRQKRDFKRTPEPAGKPARRPKKALRFVIQKHHATRLHYDFRLEMEGVLRSWAVPKGPSMNPDDKRLAMHVEDHPIDYGTFEGTIPEGNYGAGTVMLWDRGTYRPARDTDDPERELIEGYRKGDLKFVLEGEKIRGEFALVKMRGGREENAWLLLKKRDGEESEEDVTALDRSVKTGRSLEVIAGRADTGPKRKGKAPRPSRPAKTLSKAAAERRSRPKAAAPSHPKSPMPSEVDPMLATLVDDAFDREGWIFEPKWDGYRAIAELRDCDVRLLSRNKLSFTERYKEIADSLACLGHDAVLDGEIVVLDSRGKASFQLLQQYYKTKKGTLRYAVFDLLYLDGYDLRDVPLLDRKKLLERLLPHDPHVVYQRHVETEGKKAFRDAVKAGFEGVIAKDGQSRYQPGKRSPDWLKVKAHLRQEVVIGGFTAPRKSRKLFGSIIVGVYEGPDLVYCGHTGGGFNEQSLKDAYAAMKPLVRATCPFKSVPKTNERPTWIKPELVAEVSFQEWTDDGRMRQPIFEGLRTDKPAREIRRERPADAEEVVETKTVVKKGLPKKRPKLKKADDGPLPLVTNPDKVFWPKDGYTKGDLAEYYRSMADVILPYLKDRPESLNRHPNGIDGKSFYQKDVGTMPPDWVMTVPIWSESNDKEIRYLVCQDERTLLYLVNLGCIEMNPWSSRLDSLERPDYWVADLDPEDIGFDAVIEAAQAVHEVLEKCGVQGFCKTSGKTGIHIYVPTGARYTYEQVKQFALVVGNIVHGMLPKTTSLERRPVNRKKKVYLDMLQNNRGQTLACPYSVRPWPAATVSMPLEWKEVKKGLDPADFTIENARKRLEKKGDIFRGALGKGFDMKKALTRLQKSFPNSL